MGCGVAASGKCGTLRAFSVVTPMQNTSSGYDIAVIGIAGRFPGARNPEQFWRNLRDGVESVKFFTDEELLAAGESRACLGDPAYVKAQPLLEDFDRFDAGFFGFSPQDAAIMDPQHRVFLEVGWEALEDAGHESESFPGTIGVFATCGMNTYMMYHLVNNRRIMDSVGEWLIRHTGNDMNFLATRLSYELNLRGPSMNVQTACSSALVAIHLACQSLMNGECDMALAGGSTIVLPQGRGYHYKPGEILSRDGHCRAFDAKASGTLFGSGAGVVVLRRLADAAADGDRILGVIKGSAITNDGSDKVGYLAPSVDGQAKAVTEALVISGVDPESISYIETHGTGTIVGDPIEVAALTQAFRQFTEKKGFCAIGSLKSNIGHLGEAAGVAAFIKTILALNHREIPSSLHYESPNPQIDFASSPFFVNPRLARWPASAGPRRAGITSLGAGGTNCHVIVEEPPPSAPTGPSRPRQLLLLSARTPSALESATKNLASHLKEHPELDLADVAYTLHTGREAFAHRRALVCSDRDEAIAALETKKGVISSAGKPSDRAVTFLFPGQGAQYPNMGRELYRFGTVVPSRGRPLRRDPEAALPRGSARRDLLCRTPRPGAAATEPNGDGPAGAVPDRVCSREALDELGRAAARDDRPQRRRIRRGMSGRCLLAGRRARAGGGPRPIDAAGGGRDHACRATPRSGDRATALLPRGKFRTFSGSGQWPVAVSRRRARTEPSRRWKRSSRLAASSASAYRHLTLSIRP